MRIQGSKSDYSDEEGSSSSEGIHDLHSIAQQPQWWRPIFGIIEQSNHRAYAKKKIEQGQQIDVPKGKVKGIRPSSLDIAPKKDNTEEIAEAAYSPR